MSHISYTSADETGNDSGTGLMSSRKQAILSGTPYTVTKMFPWRLHEMLDQVAQDGNESVVSWLHNGRAFKVHSPDVFVRDIIKNHFRQSKFKSFQRQLNLWGFERSKKGSTFERGCYFHPLFVKGRKDLCQDMVRQKFKAGEHESKTAISSVRHPAHHENAALSMQGTAAVTVASATGGAAAPPPAHSWAAAARAPTFTAAAATEHSADATASLSNVDVAALLREVLGSTSNGSIPNNIGSSSPANGVDVASLLLSANPALLHQLSQYQQLTNMLYSARVQANTELANAIRARDALETFVAHQSPIVGPTGTAAAANGRPSTPPLAVTSTSGSSATGGSTTSTNGGSGGAPSSESDEPASSSGSGAPSSESEERNSSTSNSTGGSPSSEEEEPTTSNGSSNGDVTTSEDDEEESSSTNGAQ